MFHSVQSCYGKLILSHNALAKLVGMATIECYGVAGMTPQNLSDGLAAILGHESLAKGVKVVKKDNDSCIAISVNIVVGYGVNIGQVARNIKDKVAYMVGHCTGLKVNKVDVNVQGVKVDKSNE